MNADLGVSSTWGERDQVPPVGDEGKDTTVTTSSCSRTAGSGGCGGGGGSSSSGVSHDTHYKSHLVVLKWSPRVTHLLQTLASYGAVGLPFSQTY